MSPGIAPHEGEGKLMTVTGQSDQTVVPAADSFCDIVMKGGITSGIVYPPLVDELAKHYRFKCIGGTSAGAIAAAATAAAEYRRRGEGMPAAFPPRLGKLPDELGAYVGCGRTTKLFSLFQPDPGCRRLFRVLSLSLNAGGTWRRVFWIVTGFLLGYWWATLLSLLLAWWVAGMAGWATGAHVLVLALLLIVGGGVYRDVTRNLVANNYGMCNGMTVPGEGREALTPWLHGLIQELSGKPANQPLTFEDLWTAPGFPPEWLKVPSDVVVRSIDLRMFTTNLSTGRPFVLPLTYETCRLFYQTHELEKYLPGEVMAFIEAHATDYAPRSESDPPVAEMQRRNLKLREFDNVRFPVLLAARMSLSFPLLFSAVPLWAIDYDPKEGERTFQRCLFSDGGISSNFPIHMFDGFLPLWPTFGIQLEPKLKDRDNMVYLPQHYLTGYGERWNRFDEAGRSASRMGGFLAAILNAMQNWNDNTAARMPGVRDRVVRVRLRDKEGGMNLNMPRETITHVARRGREAAQELVERFVAPAPGWDAQRWVRLRVVLETLRIRFRLTGITLNQWAPGTTSYDELVRMASGSMYEGEEGSFSQAEAEALLRALDAMRKFDETLGAESRTYPPFFEIPRADLKVRPSL